MDLSWAIWLVGLLIYFTVSVNFALRSQLKLKHIMRAARSDEFAWVNALELERLTRELQDLGFVVVVDFVGEQHRGAASDVFGNSQFSSSSAPMQNAPPLPTPGHANSGAPRPAFGARTFARVFVHTTHGCYANLMQSSSDTAQLPFRINVLSLWGSGVEGWSYAAVSREPIAAAWLIRTRHGLWTRHVGASAAQLLEEHLRRRATISSRLGAHRADVSAENYLAFERDSLQRIRAAIRTKNPLAAVWEHSTFRLSRHDEWMGDLAKLQS